MIQYFGSRIDTEFIISHLLSSREYQMLCANLYSNWTNKQLFYFTKNFAGEPEIYSCEIGHASAVFLDQKKFILQVQNLLPDNQKEQLSYLINNKIMTDYVRKLFDEPA